MRSIACLLVALPAILTFSSCRNNNTLFEQVDAAKSGVHFNNRIIENAQLNPLKEINIYNGGGVGVGDFNNDGLQDIYFTGSMVANKLYLNKGDFKFEDITDAADVAGKGRWCRGVSVVDINNDQKPDLYISAAMSKDNASNRQNMLYVNQGNNKEGIPLFKEMAEEYGLNDTTHSAMANFFDYDNDGDLDVYIVVNESIANQIPSNFRPIIKDGTHPSTDRLYRNDWNDSLNHGVFVNVSKEAGILIEGFGHAAAITDINNDGWKDIYVSNDFVSNNILYINNGNGTFTDRCKEYFKNTAMNAMGVDIQDINNDGLQDVIELDMNPEDNYRKKMMMAANSYQTFQNFDRYNYQYQYVRNTLQLNQGPTVKQNDSIGIPAFSQIGFLGNIAETDWSWTPLVNDFDGDGFRDLIVTNGYPKDVTDHDFMIYRVRTSNVASAEEILTQVPEVKLHNYVFKNNGKLQFADVSKDWGFSVAGFSSGASYADLDNDGDMDVIINNINDEAYIYKNTSKPAEDEGNHFINISFSGEGKNINGIGALVQVYYDKDKQQVYEHTPYRGYISSVQSMAHFGLGKTSQLDSIIVSWPNHKKQVLKNIKADQVLALKMADAKDDVSFGQQQFAYNALFREVTDSVNMHFKHHEKDYIDFNVQKLIPHKLSEYSPALAVADLNGDGLDDMICSGNSLDPATLFFQQPNGQFEQQLLFPKIHTDPKPYGKFNILTDLDFKDSGILLFDADGDGDNDLYVSSGGYEHDPNTKAYQDRFYLNNGKGVFSYDSSALPQNFTSKFCVRASDYDKDGDLDLFVAGRVEPWTYPKPVSSYIFRNDSKNGKVQFTDVTNTIAKDLLNIGLVCDGLFTDIDNDGWPDLMLAGEWMPISFLKNDKGVFKKFTTKSPFENMLGWWNTIAPGDFDNDGDIDYIVGNLGLNSIYKASEEYPVYITAKDFDENGSYDAFPSLFLPGSHEITQKSEYPMALRDDIVKQMISMRKKYTNYKPYANATMSQLFTPEQMKDAIRLKANSLGSAYLRNDGNGKFSISALPVEAQFSVLNGISVNDYNGDGNLDVVINGNDFGTEVSIGRYDALNGLLLTGDGKGNFSPLSILKSGIYIPGDGKALVSYQSANGRSMLAASQHNGPIKILELKKQQRVIPVAPDDVFALVSYKNGNKQRREIYYGSSFLSQSARPLTIDNNVVAVSITNSKGSSRTIPLNN